MDQDSLARAAAKAAGRVTFDHGVGWVLLALGVLFAAANWSTLLQQVRRTSREQQAASFVPFVGGIVGVIGLGMLDVPWSWRWVPALADFGTGPYLLAMVIAIVFSRGDAPPPSGDAPGEKP